VSDSISQGLLLRAISHGLVSYLVRSQSTLDDAVQAVLDSQDGTMHLPDHLTRVLVEELRAGRTNPAGLDRDRLLVADLTVREIEVLGLFAEGLSTAEVALKLNYAERTIKAVLQGVLLRLNLRNRVHAVAYALRVGAI
jgi:DNA-binding NarL/FixJ family response regulator